MNGRGYLTDELLFMQLPAEAEKGHNAWSLETKTIIMTLEPGAWSLEPGAWSLEPGAWSLVPRA